MNRREALGAAIIGAAPISGLVATRGAAAQPLRSTRKTMVQAGDGTVLRVRDWGEGPPMVFLSSWGLGGEMWSYQRVHFANLGYRCITLDRRGHGESDRPASGYDLDTLADDVAALFDQLDVSSAVLVGHSMGGAEAIRYLSKHGLRRVSRLVLLAAVAPYIVQTADNPYGAPMCYHESVMAQWARDFPGWAAEGRAAFFAGGSISPALTDWLFAQLVSTPPEIAIATFRGLLGADLRPDLANLELSTLILHGDRDVSAPLDITGRRLAAGVSGSRLEVIEGAPHGLFVTHREAVNSLIASFVGPA